MILTLACSKKHEALPTGFAYDPLPAPTDLEVTAAAEEASLSWDYPVDRIDEVKEFRIYYYVEMYGSDQLIGTSTATSFTDSQLLGNLEYCYRVSAVDSSGFEGVRTGTVCEFVPTR